ncbi:MAG: hypothetical protein ACXQTS_06680 [Candidatus Methanospirareceae archaeon]
MNQKQRAISIVKDKLEKGECFFVFGNRLVFIKELKLPTPISFSAPIGEPIAVIYIYKKGEKKVYQGAIFFSKLYEILFKKKPRRIPKRILNIEKYAAYGYIVDVKEFYKAIKASSSINAIPEDFLADITAALLST